MTGCVPGRPAAGELWSAVSSAGVVCVFVTELIACTEVAAHRLNYLVLGLLQCLLLNCLVLGFQVAQAWFHVRWFSSIDHCRV